jgi:ribosomal silencing factor RsfS
LWLIFQFDPIRANIADYLVIAGGDSLAQIKQAAEELSTYCKQIQCTLRVDGLKDANGWIVIDTGSLMVHFMIESSRVEYNLESLYLNEARIPRGFPGHVADESALPKVQWFEGERVIPPPPEGMGLMEEDSLASLSEMTASEEETTSSEEETTSSEEESSTSEEDLEIPEPAQRKRAAEKVAPLGRETSAPAAKAKKQDVSATNAKKQDASAASAKKDASAAKAKKDASAPNAKAKKDVSATNDKGKKSASVPVEKKTKKRATVTRK